MSRLRATVLAAGTIAALAAPAWAQQSNEDRLREALRRVTAEHRSLQDNQAVLQAQLADATKERDSLRVLLDQARVQITQAPAAPALDPAELKALQEALARARADAAALQAALSKWQAAYKEAAGVAQAKDAEARRLDASLTSAQQRLATCVQANTRVIATAREILHLYESRGFKTLVLESYEPFLGLKRVELENTVQDYEDRLDDGTVRPRQTARPVDASAGR